MSSSSKRPSFVRAWSAFQEVNVPVKEVGEKIGGYVKINIDIPEEQGGFANACPIRMSYVLNSSGIPIPRSDSYKSVSGADGHQYIYRVPDFIKHMISTFGKPDVEVHRRPFRKDFEEYKGILIVRGSGWGNASGHITIWNGITCSDSCHLGYDPDNGTFNPNYAALWILK